MTVKAKEKACAIKLRKAGKSYNEILEQVPVAKSTLSLWLRDVGLAQVQKQTLSAKKRAAQLRGGARRREQRLEATSEIFEKCRKDIADLSKRELLLIGIALYWAEGSKQKDHSPSVGIDFANSDPHMVKLFMRWLRTIGQVPDPEIFLTIHLHENHLHRYEAVKKYWLEVAQLTPKAVTSPIIKKHKPKTKRKNIDNEYQGLVSIYVRKSTTLNRQISGWISAIISAADKW